MSTWDFNYNVGSENKSYQLSSSLQFVCYYVFHHHQPPSVLRFIKTVSSFHYIKPISRKNALILIETVCLVLAHQTCDSLQNFTLLLFFEKYIVYE